MAISAGTRFGAYEILEPIGKGGMGEVWRARDMELKRDVAVKVLPQSFAADADRLARFRREAEMLASLNHPNIAQVHGLEKIGEHLAIVMELVEGSTLADRISQGPIAPDEALGIARQIADALEAAHARQIVHRDLKPANIKLKDDGTVRVLDFGISKPIDASEISGSPVATPAATETGVILGTAAYMSPEQARGRFVDERTDIWAFGCLLFEMLTGQPAFGGEDVMATLARVIDRDTDLSSMPGSISPAVRQTIKLCLIKDPRKRIADIRDVRLALGGEFESELPAATAALPARSFGLSFAPVFAGIVATVALAIGIAWLVWPDPGPGMVAQFREDLPQNIIAAEISADGTTLGLVFDGRIQLRPLAESSFAPVPGADVGSVTLPPCFSPDTSWLAFVTGNAELRRIPITGGGSLPLAELDVSRTVPSCHWGRDGFIYLGDDRGVMRFPEGGGATELLVDRSDFVPLIPGSPELLPGEEKLLFTLVPALASTSTEVTLAVLDLATREIVKVAESAGIARFVPEYPGARRGYLVYARDSTVFAVPFDVTTLTAATPVPVATGILQLASLAFPQVSDNGTLVLVEGRFDLLNRTQFVRVDRDGTETPISEQNTASPTGLALSPDGMRIATTALTFDPSLSASVWQLELDGTRFTPVTSDGLNLSPQWLSDSNRLIYSQLIDSDSAVTSVALVLDHADGTGVPTTIATFEDTDTAAASSISADDRTVLGAVSRRDTGLDIFVMQLDPNAPTDASLVDLLATEDNETQASFSPDGRHIAYTSDFSGRHEVYVTTYPEPGPRTRISVDGGSMPLWNPAGGELFFLSGTRMMAVDIETDAGIRRGEPVALFDAPDLIALAVANTVATATWYAVSTDGSQFLFAKGVQQQAATEIKLRTVLNWIEVLKQQVPLD